MPSATAIATRKREVLDKPAHVHLRHFNIINNYVNIIENYVFLTQVSRWKQHETHTITISNYVLLTQASR